MRYIAPLLFWVIVLAGCDPVKDLDWERTAKDQHLRIGNRVRVDGIRWGLALYTFKRSDLTDNLWYKKTWDTELDLSIYNPDEATNEKQSNRTHQSECANRHSHLHNL